MAALGDAVVLGGNHYHDVRPVGSGAMARTYAAKLDDFPVAIKRLSDRWQSDSPDAAGFRTEAAILRTLNAAEDSEWSLQPTPQARAARALKTGLNRVIVALLDDGVDDSGRPYQVQEWAPAGVEVTPVIDLQGESRVLSIMQRVAQGIALAHQHGFALSDFEPRTKLDRIRVRWPESSPTPEVRLIDWNISGGADLFARDLFYFGQHLYHLLLGQLLELEGDGKPPHTLGMGMPAWNLLSEASHLLLSRLLQRDESRRYRAADDLAADLTWLVETFEMATAPSLLDRLRFRIIEARGQDRYDRMLAGADLALRYDLAPGQRQSFLQWRDQAREELDKELWQPIAMARISLLARQFNQADVNFSRVLSNLDPRSEPARLARYLRLQARVGQALRDRTGSDPTLLNEWGALNQGVQRLIDHAWDEAAQMLQRASEWRPDLLNDPAFNDLRAVAVGGQALNHAGEAQTRAQPVEADGERPEWAAIEERKLGILQTAIETLNTAVRGAPRELVLDDRRQQLERELKNRQRWLQAIQDAEQALQEQRYTDAETLLTKVLRDEPQHARARFLLPSAQRLTRFQQLKSECRRVLGQGEYTRALELAREAQQLFPADSEAATLVIQAEAGQIIQRRFVTDLRGCQDLIRPDLDAAIRIMQRLLAWQQPESTLAAVLRQVDAPVAGRLPPQAVFVLSPNLRSELAAVEKAVTDERFARVQKPLSGALEALWQNSYPDTSQVARALQEIERVRPWANEVQQEGLNRWQDKFATYQKHLERLQQDSERMAQAATGPRERLTASLALLRDLTPGELPAGMADAVTQLRQEGERCLDQPDLVQKFAATPQPPLLQVQQSLIRAWIDDRVQQAQSARANSDYARVKEISEQVERVAAERRPESLRALRAHADAVLTKRAEAQDGRQALIVSPSPIQADALREVLLRLHEDDQNSEARQIRAWVFERWRELLRAQDQIAPALNLANQGETLLRRLADPLLASADADQNTGASLISDRQHLEQLQQTAARCESLGDVTAGGFDALADSLNAADAYFRGWALWPKIEELQKRAVEALRKRLQDATREAEAALDVGPPEGGLASAASARALTRHAKWADALAPELTALGEVETRLQQKIEQTRAERARAEAQAASAKAAAQRVDDLISALQAGNPAWGTQAAAEAIKRTQDQLPAIDALTVRLGDCRTLQARAEALLQQPQAKSGFARALQARLPRLSDGQPRSDDTRLRQRWITQQEDLTREALEIGGSLAAALREETRSVAARGADDLADLLQLYWEARWSREALLDAAQLNDNETAAALTTALRAADLLAPDVLRGEAFSTTRSEAMDGNDAAWTQADTILQNLQQWLDQCQARPDTISLPDERGVGYKPATAIELDALATGQQLWQVLQPAATDQNIDQQLLQRLQAMSSFLDWIDSVNRVSAQTGSENGGNGEAAQNA